MPRVSKAIAPVIPLDAARARKTEHHQGYREISGGSYLPASFHREALDAALERAFAILGQEREALFAREARVTEAVDAADARMIQEDESAEASEEFPPPTSHARALARQLADRIVRAMPSSKQTVLAPRFASDPNGGVGLHWRTGRLELLIVVPPEPGASIQFYGDTLSSGDVVKGTLSSGSKIAFLAHWLASNEFPG